MKQYLNKNMGQTARWKFTNCINYIVFSRVEFICNTWCTIDRLNANITSISA